MTAKDDIHLVKAKPEPLINGMPEVDSTFLNFVF
jgi:hypothetical protein